MSANILGHADEFLNVLDVERVVIIFVINDDVDRETGPRSP